MCNNLIDRLPGNIMLHGVIIKEESGHKFFSAGKLSVDALTSNLKASKAEVIEKFHGFPCELKSLIKSLNSKAGLPGYNPAADLERMKAA